MNVESASLRHIEKLLQETLKPVPLRAEFVEALRHKLDTEVIPARLSWFPLGYIAVILASVISMALLLIVGIRAVVTLLVTLGLIRKVRRTKVDRDVVVAQVA